MLTPSPAATVVLLRAASSSFEVLLVERNGRGFFGDLAVFPGGGVESYDVPVGGAPEDDHSHRNAAIRELAEETGILLTGDGTLRAPAVRGASFYESVSADVVDSAGASLVLVSRWVTPEAAPRRFDARFYLAACSDPPEVQIDTSELVGHRWIRPADALARHDAGELNMFLPTIAHLRWLGRRETIEDAMASADGADGRTLILPRQAEDGSILPIHLPAEQP